VRNGVGDRGQTCPDESSTRQLTPSLIARTIHCIQINTRE
jgi:hypothetical protein